MKKRIVYFAGLNMKAYEPKYGTQVIALDEHPQTPPSSPLINKGDVITLFSNDGMYRTARNTEGRRVYIAGFAEVRLNITN